MLTASPAPPRARAQAFAKSNGWNSAELAERESARDHRPAFVPQDPQATAVRAAVAGLDALIASDGSSVPEPGRRAPEAAGGPDAKEALRPAAPAATAVAESAGEPAPVAVATAMPAEPEPATTESDSQAAKSRRLGARGIGVGAAAALVLVALILFSTRYVASKATPRNASPAPAVSSLPSSANLVNVAAPASPERRSYDQHGPSDMPAHDKASRSRTQKHSELSAHPSENAADPPSSKAPAPESTVASLVLPRKTAGPNGEVPEPPALQMPPGSSAVLQAVPGSEPAPSVTIATLPGSLLSSARTTAPATDPPADAPNFRVGGVVQPAKLLAHPSPVYPAAARAEHIQGTVRVIATVRKDGTVGEVKVASGNAALTGAAIDAVRQWHYRPALLNGEPVQSEMSVEMTFHLPN